MNVGNPPAQELAALIVKERFGGPAEVSRATCPSCAPPLLLSSSFHTDPPGHYAI